MFYLNALTNKHPNKNTMHTYSFEKLEFWHDSRDLIKKIYLITKKFPDDEEFGLINQIRRASISVASNLAEGISRNTNKDRAHFTQLSYSSLMEVMNQLIISEDLNYLCKNDLNEFRKLVEKISNKLNSLRRTQLK